MSENIEVYLSFNKPIERNGQMLSSEQDIGALTTSNDKKCLMQVDVEIFFPLLWISSSILTKCQATCFIVSHSNVSLLYLDNR